jgi:oligopeptide transport system permease protein
MVHALGDPVAAKFGDKTPSPAVLEQFRESLHLNEPLIVQYGRYMAGIFTGNLGDAFNGTTVVDLLKMAYPTTVKLALTAFVIEAVIGIGLGVLSGMRRGRLADTSVMVMTLVVISIPTFVIGYVLQYLLGVKWGVITPTVDPSVPFQQLIVPGLVLASVSLAYVARLTRTTIAENTKADFVRTAVAKGLPRRRVVTHHLLRNSLIPVVTFLGTDLGALMGGALVTERIFNIQGVGFWLYQGVVHQDANTTVGFVTVLVIVYLLANLLVDLLYAVLDPRIRYA